MLKKIKSYYPEAIIICGTLMRTEIKGDSQWLFPDSYAGVVFENYNNAIRRACQRNKCRLADIGSSGISYETLDGSHPTALGHNTIAIAWIKCLREMGMKE